ncbi:MAG: hypothetical protein ACYCSN_19395 [Acidobacteriaceae bacterium]
MPNDLVYDPLAWRIQEVERWFVEYTRWRTAYRESAAVASVCQVAMTEAAHEIEQRSAELSRLWGVVRTSQHITPSQAREIAEFSPKVMSARAIADFARNDLAGFEGGGTSNG